MKNGTALDRFSAYEDGQRRPNYGAGTVMAVAPPKSLRAQADKVVAAPIVRPPDPPGLLVGELDGNAGAIALDLAQLLTGRLLIQGVSGAGKSWALRRLLEQASGQVQEIVIDPEDEFDSLADEFGLLKVDGHRLDAAALHALGLRVREHRQSIVLKLGELDRAGQMIAVAAFLEALVEAPREHWHPALVAIDEAHLFAPFGGHAAADTSVRKRAIGAVVDLMGRGRKRGLAGVLATQRLARLAKSVSSEVTNFLVGGNTQDLDIRRAAEQIGWDARKAFDRLPTLEPGEFVAVGRAFSRQPAQLKVGGIKSAHGGSAPAIAPPPAIAADDGAKLLGLDELMASAEADAEIRDEAAAEQLGPGARAVRGFIRDRSFGLAARIFVELARVAPEGATVKALAKHLDVPLPFIGPALALLDMFGVLEYGPDRGEGRPVAVDRNFARTL